ncbi:hypothetical protein LJB95_00870 [Paludibacteraceae bacterium OttesenSCG-928-F17]|nr:hypothetical protein [Paludibacteraceae bacterium OttesenSCG-928-F17]
MIDKKIIRVFPSKTNATPDDENVRIRTMPGLFDEADEIHISVAFSWDKSWAEAAVKQWESVAPVKLGGPAYNEIGGDFIPGMYLKKGYVITSRGCPNRCWFCSVPLREGGKLRELPVTDGWIVTDDNLLACSESHINEVFEMLKGQPYKPQFVGGLEAALLTENMANRIFQLSPKTIYFAYDTPNDLEPLHNAGKMLFNAGFTKSSNKLRCYVLCGFKGDTFEKATKRMGEAWRAGFLPMAMAYRDEKGIKTKEWGQYQRQWASKIITPVMCKKHFGL